MNVQNNDVTVRFTVRVPAGVPLIGTTVNGDVEATHLNGDDHPRDRQRVGELLDLSSGRATTVNGTIRGELGRADWTTRSSSGRSTAASTHAALRSQHRGQSSDGQRRHLDRLSLDRHGTHLPAATGRHDRLRRPNAIARDRERRHQPQAIVTVMAA